MHQHFGLTLGLQAVEHALHTQRLAAQYGLRELEYVIPRNVQDRVFDLIKTQHAFMKGGG